jgi:hypothetical protein
LIDATKVAAHDISDVIFRRISKRVSAERSCVQLVISGESVEREIVVPTGCASPVDRRFFLE